MTKRNSFDINADILRLADGGIRVTHLVYKGNLNFGQLKKYTERLIEARLIELKDGLYITTGLGHEYLRRYKELTILGLAEFPPYLAV